MFPSQTHGVPRVRQPWWWFLAFIVFIWGVALIAPNPQHAAAAVTIQLSPLNTLTPVGSTRQFTATVSGGMTNTVAWSLIAPAGVSPTLIGTISPTGLYTAPAAPLPSFAPVTVKAASNDDANVSATTTVTVRNQVPYATSVTPNSLPLGAFTLTINGSRFVSGAQVQWNGTPLTTQYLSATQLKATGAATQAGTFNVTVANPGPGAVSSPALPVTVASGIIVSVAPSAPVLSPNATQQFAAAVANNANQAVTWQVNGTTGGNATYGSITANGLYTAPNAAPAGVITINAVSQADGTTTGSAVVTMQDPLTIKFARLLDQTTFGVTAADLAHAKQIGVNAYLDEQFTTPESPWPALAGATRSGAIDAFVNNQIAGQDQLRQRTIFALSEYIVIAMNKNTNGDEIVPWLQLLSRNAFGNYRTLLKELTLDASMGKYLDLANSGGSGAANENYPREVMQLFSIGLNKLNLDGSLQLDAQNQPMPTYTQTDVQQLALTLTGWTYSNATGTTGSGGNGAYFPGPMIRVPGRHNISQKIVLGTVIPAGQSIQQDLDNAMDIIFNHPNVGPFVATRLIRALVTSNPSPPYIARVAAVFNNNGQGQRGDLKEVIRAILTDAEARNDQPPANFGRLRTPLQHTLSLVRGLGMNFVQASQSAYLFYGMNEGLLDAPSVFGHYSPNFRIPKGFGLFGPEFQIYTPSEAVNRANWFYGFFYSPWPINPKLQPFVNLANNVPGLVSAVDNTMLQGRMLPQTRAALLNALPAITDHNQRVITAVYLTAMSGEYLVQH